MGYLKRSDAAGGGTQGTLPAARSAGFRPARSTALERCVVVSNIPTPYRDPVFERLPQQRFTVVYCARAEANRQWQLPAPRYAHRFLKPRVHARNDGFSFVHNNPDLWRVLSELRPSVVVTSGYNPTHLYAFAWALTHGARHVVMSDGTAASEASLTWKHRLARRTILARSQACIAASRAGMDLFRAYGIPTSATFQSHLCADNERFRPAAGTTPRKYDVMFAGQLHERKLPGLFVDVCAELVARRGRCRALIIGDGPERQTVLDRLSAAGVDWHYPGFVQQRELPAMYASARMLLFTTRLDPWGVVANEAMAAGTPVVTTPYAGSAGELVVDGLTGFVRPADVGAWADAACQLLDEPRTWRTLSECALRHVASYNYDAAARGIVAACDHALRA